MGITSITSFGTGPGDEPVKGVPGARELRRVIPVAQQVAVDEGLLTVTALELYEDGSILRYFIVAGSERRAELERQEREFQAIAQSGDREAMSRYLRDHARSHPGDSLYFRLEDDAGTQYWSLPRSATGDGMRYEASVGSTPATPATASRVSIKLYRGVANIETGEAEPHSPERLLHTFEVKL